MIQRIQTLFLLLVTAVSAALFFVPFAEYPAPGGPVAVTLLPGKTAASLSGLYYIPVAVNIINLVLSVFVVFRYRRRLTQMKLAYLLMALSGMLLAVLLLFDYARLVEGGAISEGKYLFGAFLPVISMAASFLAARSIKKDEDLVRSSERIR